MRSFWSLLSEFDVVIPIMQRDYAQGRSTIKVSAIRNNILSAMCKALQVGGDSLELDFIYGNTEEHEGHRAFYPLDGQQRLTTLFLLHWYIAAKEGRLDDEVNRTMERFSYETRHSSRVFCAQLVRFRPKNFDAPIGATIVNQPWFFAAWGNDPTIQSMLTMLNAIQTKVAEYQLADAWDRLVSSEGAIGFQLLPMTELGLLDDLYIKMNSRGTELTEFEYFKVRFSESLEGIQADDFKKKIDKEWSDLFWTLYKDSKSPYIAKAADAGIMRYFRFITDMLIAQKDLTVPKQDDELARFRTVYADIENVGFLFATLDLFSNQRLQDPDFFVSVFYTEREEFDPQKVRLFFIEATADLLKKCSERYDTAQRNNPFSIGEQLLLYACILHLKYTTASFGMRIRTLRNLISASEDNLRKEYMPSLLKSVYELIVNEFISDDTKFNKTQIQEEAAKSRFICEHPELGAAMYRLEDHLLLQGCLAVFNLQPSLADHASQFDRLFTPDCDYEEISRALLTFGDYTQGGSYNTNLGSRKSPSWRGLFTPSQKRADFQKTRDVLSIILEYLHSKQIAGIQSIINDYLEAVEGGEPSQRDWRYYFIRYASFRRHETGYYYWEGTPKRYECKMLQGKTIDGKHWDPFLHTIKEMTGQRVSQENYGAPLVLVNGDAVLTIQNTNSGLQFGAINEEGRLLLEEACQTGLIPPDFLSRVNQSLEGIDLEDRIDMGIRLVNEISMIRAGYVGS